MSATHTPSVPAAAAPPAKREVPREVRRRRFLVSVADHSLLIAATIAFAFPFVFMVLTSLMTTDQALSPKLWPDPFQWDNYVEVFRQAPMFRYALNTLIYSGLATLGMLVSSIPVAYALSRLRWKGRDAVFLITLVAMMLPPQVTIVPLYSMWAQADLVGTLAPLIIPNWFGDAFSIFLLRQFFMTIPQPYIDSARVDGAGELRILLFVVLPAGEAGDRGGRAVHVPVHVLGLLRAAALRGRRGVELDAVGRARAVPHAARGAVEPHARRHGARADAGDRPVLLRPEGVRRGRHAHGGEGMKLAIIGAGSTYTPELVSGLARERDRLEIDELVLHDIAPDRRDVVGALAGRMLARDGFGGTLEITGDLDRAVDGADFVLVQIRVGGQAARLSDETVPLPCGCVGQETTGAGGFAKALRTVPIVLEIADRVRERSADGAWIVDFTNPVGIVTRALLDAGHRAVGLCNVAIGFQRLMARMLGVAPERVVVDQAGLNHLTWVRAVWLDGADVLGDLLAAARRRPRRRGRAAAPAARRARRRAVVLPALLLRARRGGRGAAHGRPARPAGGGDRAQSCWRCTATPR